MNADVEQRRIAEAPRPRKPEEFRTSKTEIVTAIGMPTNTKNATESGLDLVVEIPAVSAAPSNSLQTCPPSCSTRLSGVVLGVCCEHMQIQDVGVAVGTLNLSPTRPPSLALTGRAPTPSTAVDGRKYLADYQRCWPPPTFILLISLIEIGVFAFDYVSVVASVDSALATGVSVPSDSVLIYRPDRRLELWRFVSYMLLHANWFHLGFNVVIQLLFGVPLELVHGSVRVAGVYMAGVLAGSLGTSVVDSAVYLVGASGGVYALLAAHLANVLMNFSHMRSGVAHLVPVGIFVVCDLGYALYCKYSMMSALQPALPSVSYVAHMSGSLAGFTVGLLVLRSFDFRLRTRLVRWLALGACAAFTVFAIAFNLINTMTAQMLAEEEGEVIKQHLLHDFGIS